MHLSAYDWDDLVQVGGTGRVGAQNRLLLGLCQLLGDHDLSKGSPNQQEEFERVMRGINSQRYAESCLGLANLTDEVSILKLVLWRAHEVRRDSELEKFLVELIMGDAVIDSALRVGRIWRSYPGGPGPLAKRFFQRYAHLESTRDVNIKQAYVLGRSITDTEVEEVYYSLVLDRVDPIQAYDSAHQVMV